MARVVIVLMVVMAASSTYATDPWFDTKADYSVAGGTHSVFAIDLDGDGDNDLAAASYGLGNVSILKNNGDGTFQSAVNFAAGSAPLSIFASDLDGDGDNDLAVAGGRNYVSVLKNNGDGTFQAAVNYDIGGASWSVFASDLDGDGDNDLAAAQSNGVSILKNNGDGTFCTAVNFSVGGLPLSVFASDLDGDGDNDLALANFNGSVSILKNVGNGTFQPAIFYSVGSDSRSVFASDLDGDGDNDLAVADRGTGHVSILKNNGDGTFQVAVNYEANNGSNSVFASDLDGDGDNDLAVARYLSGNVSILKNNGDGTFQSAVNFAVGSNPYTVFASDLDGDGDNDLAVANEGSGSVSILMNLTALPHIPTVIRVPSDQPTIQAGVDAAWSGDTVLVADGTYSGEGNRDIRVSNKSIVLTSEHGAQATTVDCGATPSDQHDGIEVCDCPSPGVQIKGLTVVGTNTLVGAAIYCESAVLAVDSCNFYNNTSPGAIYITNSTVAIADCEIADNSRGVTFLDGESFQLRRCRIRDNSGDGVVLLQYGAIVIDSCEFASNNGRGLQMTYQEVDVSYSTFSRNLQGIEAIYEGNARLRIRHCQFIENGPTTEGAGVSVSYQPFYGNVQIDSCLFMGNTADKGGAAWVYATSSHPRWDIFTGCLFVNNNAVDGGAVYFAEAYKLTISACRFAANTAQRGGAVYILSSWETELAGCTFTGNAAVDGAHVYIDPFPYSQPVIMERNLLIAGIDGSAIQCDNTELTPSLSCTDLFGNAGGDWVGCIGAQYGQNGNISVDPLFCDPANSDYSLYSFSPCAAANNSCGQLIGAYDVGCTAAGTLALPNELTTTNVTNHSPVLGWTFQPASGWQQSEFEIAVGTDSNWAYAEMWNPAPFQSPQTSVVYAGAALLDGSTYYARVRTKLNGSWSPWYESSFRMNSLPTKPVVTSPLNGSIVGAQPTLFVDNSTDAEGDPLSYQFEVYVNPNSPTPVDASDLVPEGSDSTGWTVNAMLTENETYYWRSRAWDGFEYSDWSSYSYFSVNGNPEAPSIPNLTAPSGENLILYDMLPTFSWTEATDPDPFDEVKYRLELSFNQNFTLVVPFDNLSLPSYQMADSLLFSQRYWWRVKAIDKTGLFTLSEPYDFWTWTLGDLNRTHDCTIGDISIMIDHLFISSTPIDPPKVGDVNATCNITIGDVSLMIDHLFISGAQFKVGCE